MSEFTIHIGDEDLSLHEYSSNIQTWDVLRTAKEVADGGEITTGHLLYGLFTDPDVADYLSRFGVTSDAVREQLSVVDPAPKAPSVVPEVLENPESSNVRSILKHAKEQAARDRVSVRPMHLLSEMSAYIYSESNHTVGYKILNKLTQPTTDRMSAKYPGYYALGDIREGAMRMARKGFGPTRR